MKNLTKISALAALMAAALACSARAVTITNPITLQKEFVVGAVNFVQGQGTNTNTELGLAQTILNLGVGGTSSDSNGHDFAANTVFDYSDTLTNPNIQIPDSTSISAGFQYALAKYDGTNAGYVLFKLNGEASTIPQYSYDLWGNAPNPDGSGAQYSISHYTLFNTTNSDLRVPDGGSTIALLGAALMLIAGIARRGVSLAEI